jgi:hypothetical protein
MRLFAVGLLVGVVACGTGELTRSHAARELAARFAGPQAPRAVVRVFRANCVEKHFEKYPPRFREDMEAAHQYRVLTEAGFATQFSVAATSERCGTPYPESLRIIGIQLTPKGRAEQWPEHREGAGGWDVTVATRRELIAVTAIEPQPDPALARVVYAWRWIPTPGGRALGQTDARRESRVTFRRDQTGWRMSTVRENRGTIGEPENGRRE